MGILDQDVSDKISLAVPQLYRRGLKRQEWTQFKFWYVSHCELTGVGSLMCYRLYMIDGVYQSAICFFMGYLVFAPATFATKNGRDINERERIGVYIACPTIMVINVYVLLNTFRWDWLIVLIVAISILLVWFWTGVYSSAQASFQFYKAGAEVFGQLTFWVLCLLIVIICLLPRFSAKFIQKNYFPLDIDIVREQVRQGKFRHLDNYEAYVPPSPATSSTSSDTLKPIKRATTRNSVPDSQRRIYPPSETATARTRKARSQEGSDGTNSTLPEFDYSAPPRRPSIERVRSSFERARASMDKLRPSFESSRDFTSAALLTRIESSHSNNQSPATPTLSRRRQDITDELQ